MKYRTANQGLKISPITKTNQIASAAGLWLMSAVISHSRRFKTCGCLKNTQHRHSQPHRFNSKLSWKLRVQLLCKVTLQKR